jgi:hypothetical protein
MFGCKIGIAPGLASLSGIPSEIVVEDLSDGAVVRASPVILLKLKPIQRSLGRRNRKSMGMAYQRDAPPEGSRPSASGFDRGGRWRECAYRAIRPGIMPPDGVERAFVSSSSSACEIERTACWISSSSRCESV